MLDQLQNIFLWITYEDLNTELAQLGGEGKKIPSSVKTIIEKLKELGHEELFAPDSQAIAGALLDKTIALPTKRNYPFVEPSDLAKIRLQRPKGPRRLTKKLPQKIIADRIHGAWLGR